LQEKNAKKQRIKLCEDEFNKAKDDFEKWAKKMRDEIKKPFDNFGERLDHLRSVQNSLPDGQVLLLLATESATRLLAESEDSDEVKTALDDLKQDYEKLNREINEKIVDLSSKLVNYEELRKKIGELSKWFEANRDDLKRKPHKHQGDMNQLRALLDRYKNLLQQIEDNNDIIKKLKEEAVDFNLDKELNRLQRLNDEAENTCRSSIADLESDSNEIQNYNQLLQEIEKWLLQQSMRLMAHHSLQITNVAKCNDELKKHSKVLDEIKAYTGINELKKKGKELVDKYHCDKAKIDFQVRNVSESYDALINQGLKIKTQLENAKEKYEIYEKTLADCEAILEEHSASDLNMNPETIDEAKNEITKGKAIIEKLNECKAILQTAIQDCFDATVAVSRPSSPEQPVQQQPPVPERETNVKLRLGDLIEQIDAQIAALHALIDEKTDFEKKCEAIEKWATEKEDRLSEIESEPHEDAAPDQKEKIFEKEMQELDAIKEEAAVELCVLRELNRKSRSKPRKDLEEKLQKLQEHAELIKSSRAQVLKEESLNLMNEISNSIQKCTELLDEEEKRKALKERIALLEEAENILESQIEPKINRVKGKQRDVIEAKVEELRRRLKARQQSVDELKASVDDIKQELYSIRSWIYDTLQKIRETEDAADLAFIQNEVNNKLKGVFATLRSRVESVEDCDDFDLDAIKKQVDELKGALTAKEKELKDRQLEELNSEMTNWVETKLKEIESVVVKQKLPRQEAVEEEDEETILEKLEEEIANFDRQKVNDVFAQRCREFNSIDKLQEMRSKVKDLRDALQRKKKLLKDKQRLNEVIKTIVTNIEVIETAVDEKEDAIEDEIQRLNDLLKECDKIDRELDKLQNLMSEVDQSLKTEALKEEMKKLRKRQKKAKETLKKLLDENEATNVVVKEFVETQESLQTLSSKQVDFDNSDIEDALKECDTLKKRLEDQLKRLKNLNVEKEVNDCEKTLRDIDKLVNRLRKMLRNKEQFKKSFDEVKTIIETNLLISEESTTAASISETEEKIKKLESVIEDCETRIPKIEKKVKEMLEDGASEACRQRVMNDLQDLKNLLMKLKKFVQNLKAQHSKHLRIRAELENAIQKLKELDGKIVDDPSLRMQNIESDLSDQQRLENEANSVINKGDEVIARVEQPEKNLFQKQIDEFNQLKQSVSQRLKNRRTFIEDAHGERMDFDRAKGQLLDWLNNAEALITKSLPDECEQLNECLTECDSLLDDLNNKEDDCARCQALAAKICSLLKFENEKVLISKELQLIDDRIEQFRKGANGRKDEIKKKIVELNNFDALLDKIAAILSEFEKDVKNFKDQQPKNVAELRDIVNKLSQKSNELQEQQELMQELNTKSIALNKSNDPKVEQLNARWESLLVEIENLLTLWADLLNRWENYIDLESSTRSFLKEYRKKAETTEDIDELKEILTAVNALSDPISELSMLGSNAPLADYIEDTSSSSSLESEQKELVKYIEEKLDVFEAVFKAVSDLKKVLIAIESELIGIDGLMGDTDEEQKLELFKNEVENCRQEVEKLSKAYKFVRNQVRELEPLIERVYSIIEDKERDFAKAKNYRQDYLTGVDTIMKWIEKSKEILEDSRGDTPEVAKRNIKEVYSELKPMKEHLNRLIVGCGNMIREHGGLKEAALVETTLKGLTDELNDLESNLKRRKSEIEKALDWWQQFGQLKEVVENWIENVTPHITHDTDKEPEETTLSKVKEKLAEVKKIGTQTSNGEDITPKGCLVEMSQCLAKISLNGCSVGPLSDEYDQLEQTTTQVEFKVLQEIAILTELLEEWEQCNEKLNQVRNWIQNFRDYIVEMPSEQEISLKDQLCEREKLLSDAIIQTTKILLATEKLSVHLNRLNLIQSPKPTALLAELDRLQSLLKEQVKSLTALVTEEEHEQLKKNQLEQAQAMKEQMKESDVHFAHLKHQVDEIVSHFEVSSSRANSRSRSTTPVVPSRKAKSPSKFVSKGSKATSPVPHTSYGASSSSGSGKAGGSHLQIVKTKDEPTLSAKSSEEEPSEFTVSLRKPAARKEGSSRGTSPTSPTFTIERPVRKKHHTKTKTVSASVITYSASTSSSSSQASTSKAGTSGAAGISYSRQYSGPSEPVVEPSSASDSLHTTDSSDPAKVVIEPILPVVRKVSVAHQIADTSSVVEKAVVSSEKSDHEKPPIEPTTSQEKKSSETKNKSDQNSSTSQEESKDSLSSSANDTVDYPHETNISGAGEGNATLSDISSIENPWSLEYIESSKEDTSKVKKEVTFGEIYVYDNSENVDVEIGDDVPPNENKADDEVCYGEDMDEEWAEDANDEVFADIEPSASHFVTETSDELLELFSRSEKEELTSISKPETDVLFLSSKGQCVFTPSAEEESLASNQRLPLEECVACKEELIESTKIECEACQMPLEKQLTLSEVSSLNEEESPIKEEIVETCYQSESSASLEPNNNQIPVINIQQPSSQSDELYQPPPPLPSFIPTRRKLQTQASIEVDNDEMNMFASELVCDIVDKAIETFSSSSDFKGVISSHQSLETRKQDDSDENGNKCVTKSDYSKPSAEIDRRNSINKDSSLQEGDEDSSLIDQTSSESLETADREEKDEFEMWLKVAEARLNEVLSSKIDENNLDELSIRVNRLLELKHDLQNEFDRKTLYNKRNTDQLESLYQLCCDELNSSQLKLEKFRCSSPQLRSIRSHLIPSLPKSDIAELHPQQHQQQQQQIHRTPQFRPPFGSRQTSEERRNIYSYIYRAFRASIPLQVLLLFLLGAATLVPTIEEDYSCVLVNNFGSSFEPVIDYPNGPPPI
ncbi:Nesprin-1-like protein, partial [Dinothrombium tinctorium]